MKQSLDQPFKRYTAKYCLCVLAFCYLLFFNSQRMTYTEAIEILSKEHEKSHRFEFEPKVSHLAAPLPGPLPIQLVCYMLRITCADQS